MSNNFDDHFSTIGPKLACKIPLNNGPSFEEFKYLWHLKRYSNQVLSLFKNLNKSEGAGPDGIYSQLIIDCADLIAPHILSTTFNSSLANGIFP